MFQLCFVLSDAKTACLFLSLCYHLQRVSVGPFCTVGPEVQIGNACQLHAGSHVTGNTVLGDNCTVLR